METIEHILSMSMSNSVEGGEYGFRIQAHIISWARECSHLLLLAYHINSLIEISMSLDIFFPFIELRVIDFDHSQSKRETPVKLHSLWPKEVPFISIVLLSTILIMTPVYHDAGLYWWCYPNDTRDRDRETEPKLEPGLFPFNQIDEKPCSLENLIGNIYSIHNVKCQTILSPNSHCASIHNGFDPWWYWYHCRLSSAFCCASLILIGAVTC